VRAPALRSRLRADAGTAWLAVCVTGFVALCWLMRRFVTDDAWISARYAENIASGHGFVWNPSGPRAEGFSNPFLVATEAVAHVLGLSTIGTARAIGVASGVALLVVLHRLAPAAVGRRATWVALALTAFYPPIALWSVGGLETTSVALALTLGVLLLVTRAGQRGGALLAGGVLAFLPWLRPEGLVVALAAVVALEAPALLRRGGRREALTRLALAGGPPLAAQAALEIGRLLVYGHLMPNSVVYKTGSPEQFTVLEKFWDQSTPVVLAAALGLVLSRGRLRALAVPPAVYALGSIGTLDSVNAFSRFLLPAWPLLALLAGVAVAAVSRRLAPLRVALPVAAVVAFAVLHSPEADLASVRGFSARYAACKEGARTDAAAWLRRSTPRAASFALSDAGLVPARSGERHAIDQLMLNDPVIQATGPLAVRRRVNIVLRRHPDVVVLVSRSANRFVAEYETDAYLARDLRFRRYRLAHVALGVPADRCAYHLYMYERRGLGPPHEPQAPARRAG
jgi:hypothetical protein